MYTPRLNDKTDSGKSHLQVRTMTAVVETLSMVALTQTLTTSTLPPLWMMGHVSFLVRAPVQLTSMETTPRLWVICSSFWVHSVRLATERLDNIESRKGAHGRLSFCKNKFKAGACEPKV